MLKEILERSKNLGNLGNLGMLERFYKFLVRSREITTTLKSEMVEGILRQTKNPMRNFKNDFLSEAVRLQQP